MNITLYKKIDTYVHKINILLDRLSGLCQKRWGEVEPILTDGDDISVA